MNKQGYYLNELVNILKETENNYTIEYEDGVLETISKTALDSVFTVNTKRNLFLGRNIPPKRKSRLNQVNRKRKAKLFKRNFGSIERVKFVKSLPCLICGTTPSVNAHIFSRGSMVGTYKDIVPLCNKHHKELDEQLGKTKFETKYNINLIEAAEKLCKILDTQFPIDN